MWVQNGIQEMKEQKKMLPWPGVYDAAVAVGKADLALQQCGTQESGESSWLWEGDIESQVGADRKWRRLNGDDPR